METHSHFAGLGRRFWALTIDGLLFCVVFFPVTRIVKGVWLMSPADHQWSFGLFISDPLCLVFLAVMFLYFVLLEGAFGMTLGKSMVGIRVVSRDGTGPGLRRALLRNLMRLIDGLPAFSILGVLMIIGSSERTRAGDLVAGTRVVRIWD
jgi:uncharacterized RDD family membrane protein YckC